MAHAGVRCAGTELPTSVVGGRSHAQMACQEGARRGHNAMHPGLCAKLNQARANFIRILEYYN